MSDEGKPKKLGRYDYGYTQSRWNHHKSCWEMRMWSGGKDGRWGRWDQDQNKKPMAKGLSDYIALRGSMKGKKSKTYADIAKSWRTSIDKVKSLHRKSNAVLKSAGLPELIDLEDYTESQRKAKMNQGDENLSVDDLKRLLGITTHKTS